MFAYIFISSGVLYISSALDILPNLLEEEEQLNAIMRGFSVANDENKIISGLSKLPFTEQIKFDVWYNILRFRSIESLHLMDWKKYEPLLPYLPLSFLRQINFTNDEILTYFGQQKLSHLAEEVLLRSGDVLQREEEILKLGNIICGFTKTEMATIKDSMLRSLLGKDFFRSIIACSPGKLAYLSELVKRHTVIGPPRTWPPETVSQAGYLISGLKPLELREIREKSFRTITTDVIESAPVELLKVVRDSQLKALNRCALMAWRRKTSDLRPLYRSEASRFPVEMSLAIVLPVSLSSNRKGVS